MALAVEKRKFTINFDKENKRTAYKYATVTNQKVPFTKLLDEISGSCGVGRAQAKAVVEALIDRMVMFMDFGMPVELGEFGTFKPTINSRSAASADELTAESVKRKKILFYPGKRFKAMLSDVSVINVGDDFDDPEEETPTEDEGRNPPSSGGSSETGGEENGGGTDSGNSGEFE